MDGDLKRVLSFSDFDEEGIGVRPTGREKGAVHRYDVLGEYAQLAAGKAFFNSYRSNVCLGRLACGRGSQYEQEGPWQDLAPAWYFAC